MYSRRDYLKTLGGAALASTLPLSLLADSERLPTRAIPGTDLSLPVVGFGNSQAFRDGNRSLSEELIEILLEFGGSYIDAGGSSRLLLGELIREHGWHNDLFLGTYIRSMDGEGAQREISAFHAADGNESPMDLVLSANLEEFGSNAGMFRQLKEDGLARFVGVARHRQSYHQEMMRLMKAGQLDFVQVNYSLLEPEAEERLLPMAQEEGVAILVNRPFINGQYFQLVKGRELPAWAAEFDCHSWAQFSLKYILSHPAVTCVLTETSNTKHARDNLAGGLGALPDQKTRERMLKWMQDQ